MGGNAFNFMPNAFPRLPPPVYQYLKSHLIPVLQSLYVEVAVPIEAPEKPDHGDLDFIVCTPRQSSFQSNAAGKVNVPHELVKEAIGATHCVLEDGNRTSNFAVPIKPGSWNALGYTEKEEESRKEVERKDIFYQVDVHVCADRDEWRRIQYFHSYGDLGMIMGLVARNVGLVLGVNGLKYQHPPHPTLVLSENFDEISKFFRWSSERRDAGFKSRQEIYDWVTTSRFFDPRSFRTSGQGIKQVKAQRTMYSEFTTWVNEQLARSELKPAGDEDIARRRQVVRKEALTHFGRHDEVEAYLREYSARKLLRDVFNGANVNAWTSMGTNWRGVKIIMDAVRERHGGDEGVLQILISEGEDGVKRRVMDAQESSEWKRGP